MIYLIRQIYMDYPSGNNSMHVVTPGDDFILNILFALYSIKLKQQAVYIHYTLIAVTLIPYT